MGNRLPAAAIIEKARVHADTRITENGPGHRGKTCASSSAPTPRVRARHWRESVKRTPAHGGKPARFPPPPPRESVKRTRPRGKITQRGAAIGEPAAESGGT